MAKVELIMPKMGESVAEATIISWHKEVGETIEMDETIVEIATDKVDSEVPSSLEGKLVEKLFDVDAVVKVGEPFAIIETDADESDVPTPAVQEEVAPKVEEVAQKVEEQIEQVTESIQKIENTGDRFYSPLVRSIASEEGISVEELDTISGSGKDGRVTKNDLLQHIANRTSSQQQAAPAPKPVINTPPPSPAPKATTPPKVSVSGDSEII